MQLLLSLKLDPDPLDITPLSAVSVDPDVEQMESVVAMLLEAEYVASNPDPLPDPSDMKTTFMYPVDVDTGSGKVEPLYGLVGNSVAAVQADVAHEYTLTLLQHCSVLKLVNESVTVFPGDEMMT